MIPGANGEFCILKNHVNFLCRTDPGIIRISWLKTRRGREDFIYVLISSGMFYLKDNTITIVCLRLEDPYFYELKDTHVTLEISQNWTDRTRRICESLIIGNKITANSTNPNRLMDFKWLWSPKDPFTRYTSFTADSFDRYLEARKRLCLAKVRKKAALLVKI